MASVEDIKDRVTRQIRELGWSMEAATGEATTDRREEPEQRKEVISGVYRDYRLSMIFDSTEPDKVEIIFEDSTVEHQHRRGTRRPWSTAESLPTPEQAVELLWWR